jgi:hypothetical protein
METKNRTNSPKARPHIWADRFSGGQLDTINTDDPFEGVVATSGCIFFFILLGLLALLVFSLPRIFTILNENIENKSLLGAIVAASALVVGISLYQLRKYRRGMYGLLEISFAVITAWLAIGKLSTEGDLSVWLAFGGAAYLTVRGLDNIQVSREEAKKTKTSEEAKDVSLHAGEPNNSFNRTRN